MLVLARKPDERIIIPDLNTIIQVVGIKGNSVRIGIEAPADVTVLREEVFERQGGRAATKSVADRLRELNHLIRNRMNTATIGLGLLRRQIQASQADHAYETITKLEREFAALR